MIILIECLVLCLLFSIFAFCLSLNPIKSLYNYPKMIQDRVKSMSEYQGKIPSGKNKIVTKVIVSVVIIIVVSLIMRYINGFQTFKESFRWSLFIWTIVNLYDAIVIDMIWFCHSKKVIIKGTEDMVNEYHNYWFHLKESLKGEIIGLVVCVIIGLIIQFVL